MSSGYVVYKNILTFATDAKYRNLELVSDEAEDEREFVSEIERKQYYMIKFQDTSQDPPKQVYIFIFPSNSRYIKKSADFTLVAHLIQKQENEKIDIIAITADPVNTHINKKINGEFKKRGISVYNYVSDLFIQVLPEAENVTIPVHRVVRDSADIQKILDENHLQKVEQLPKIPLKDPQVVWIGGQVGDIIEIIGPSENSGKRISYKVVG